MFIVQIQVQKSHPAYATTVRILRT